MKPLLRTWGDAQITAGNPKGVTCVSILSEQASVGYKCACTVYSCVSVKMVEQLAALQQLSNSASGAQPLPMGTEGACGSVLVSGVIPLPKAGLRNHDCVSSSKPLILCPLLRVHRLALYVTLVPVYRVTSWGGFNWNTAHFNPLQPVETV